MVIEEEGVSALVVENSNNGSISRVNLETGTVAPLATDFVAPGDVLVGSLALDPRGEGVLLATGDTLISVNLTTGAVATVRDFVCGDTAAFSGLTGIGIEAGGDTALLSHVSCGLLRVRVLSVEPGCTPPSELFADNTGAVGLAEALVSNIRLDEGKLKGDIRIENFLRLWLGVRDVSISPAESSELVADKDAGVEGELAVAGVIPPSGSAAWVASFCSPGTITVELGPTSLSTTLTIVDILTPSVSFGTLISLAIELEQVPKVAEAIACLMSSPEGIKETIETYQCAARALFELVRDPVQRNQVWEIFKSFGIDLTLGELVRLLISAPLDLLKNIGDQIVWGIQTNWSYILTIELEGN